MGRAKLLEQFVFAWYYGISCAYLLFECVLKSAHIASRMSAQYALKKTIKMGLKDLKLFLMEQISLIEIQGCTKTRQYWGHGIAARAGRLSCIRHFCRGHAYVTHIPLYSGCMNLV